MDGIIAHATGLEARFDEELAAEIPGWKRENEIRPSDSKETSNEAPGCLESATHATDLTRTERE